MLNIWDCLSVGCFIVDALWDLTPLYADWQVCFEAAGVGGLPLQGSRKGVFVSIRVSVHGNLPTLCYIQRWKWKFILPVIKTSVKNSLYIVLLKFNKSCCQINPYVDCEIQAKCTCFVCFMMSFSIKDTRYGWKINRQSNMKCLSKVLGIHHSPKQLP